MTRFTRALALGVAVTAAVASCGGGAAFRLSSDDNDAEALSAALAAQVAPPAGQPLNATGKPMAFLVAREKGSRALMAYDLGSKQQLWKVTTDVTSKVVVGRNFVAHVEGGKKLVARNLTSGQPLWTHPLIGAELFGVAADTERVYYTVKESGERWVLVALDGASGSELWQTDAPGQLGAPAARGGLVFSPFLKQWLAVLDARTGKQLARIRGEDEEISFVRATTDQVFFGSKTGVFLLDERAASGKRSGSTYGSAKLPAEFVRVHYYWDAFDTVQAGYSAYDRNRILWRGGPEGDDLAFKDGRVVLHNFRFFFGFDAKSGALAWAYSHPRNDVIGSAHAGSSIVFASRLGELGALDPATGRKLFSAKIKGQFLGATFDCEGWAPSEPVAVDAPGTAAALASIAQDRDARFNDVKRFAVAALSTLPGADVTLDLLKLIQHEKTPGYLRQTATEVLVARKDPAGLPHLAAALGVRYDYITGTRPRAVGVVAQALAEMGDRELDAAARGKAVEGLLVHLHAPTTSIPDLAQVIRALGAIGGASELAPLRSFVLTYRADPAFSAQVAPMVAAIDVLLRRGGAAEYELVAFVASDPRTRDAVAEYARQALTQLDRERGDDGQKPAKKAGAEPTTAAK